MNKNENPIEIQLTGQELIEHNANTKNYTRLKNVYIDERATTFKELSDNAYIMGLYLVRASYENQVCNQTTEYIAKTLGKSPVSITRALNDLEKCGFVKLHKRKEQLENGKFISHTTIIDVSPLYRVINARQIQWATENAKKPKCENECRSKPILLLTKQPILDTSPKCENECRQELNNNKASSTPEITESQETEVQKCNSNINNVSDVKENNINYTSYNASHPENLQINEPTFIDQWHEYECICKNKNEDQRQLAGLAKGMLDKLGIESQDEIAVFKYVGKVRKEIGDDKFLEILKRMHNMKEFGDFDIENSDPKKYLFGCVESIKKQRAIKKQAPEDNSWITKYEGPLSIAKRAKQTILTFDYDSEGYNTKTILDALTADAARLSITVEEVVEKITKVLGGTKNEV